MELKFAFEVAGYFLYLGFRVVFLPVEAVLYTLLALLLVYQHSCRIAQQAARLFAKSALTVKQGAWRRLLPAKRWQLGWHLNKVS